jgi:dCTP deaminase
MILSDREILAALNRGAVKISPTPHASSEKWSSTALDLTLDSRLQVWKPMGGSGAQTIICPDDAEFNVTALANEHATAADCTQGFTIEPGMFLLGWTVEKVQLPHTSRIAARVEGKSSLARLGIGVHVTAPTIHAGFGYREDDSGLPRQPDPARNLECRPLEDSAQAGARDLPVDLRGGPRHAQQGLRRTFHHPGPRRPGGLSLLRYRAPTASPPAGPGASARRGGDACRRRARRGRGTGRPRCW